MKKYKWISVIMAVLLLLPLVGCTTGGPTTSSLPSKDLPASNTDSTVPSATETTTVAPATTTTTTTAKKPTTTTTTTKKPTTTAPKPTININGPEYEGYRLVRDAVEKLRSKKNFVITFGAISSVYENGEAVPFNDYEGVGTFAPGAPTSTKRRMEFFSTVRHGAAALFMCQHSKDVFYSHIQGHNGAGQAVWAKKRFSSDSLTDNLALAEAAVQELRQLPSAANAANVKILPDTQYGAQKNYRSVTIPVTAAEFSKLYENSIRFYNFIILEPDKTLQYTVRDCEVEYIITADGYLYDMVLHYRMDIKGTENGQPYQKDLNIYSHMRLSNYNNDTVPEHTCYAPNPDEFEKIANPGWIYYRSLPQE